MDRSGYTGGFFEPLTRAQWMEYQAIEDEKERQRYAIRVWQARLRDPVLKEREMAIIEQEEQEDKKRERRFQWVFWCVLLLVFVVSLFVWGYAKVFGFLMAIGIFFWLFKIFGWLLLPMIGGVFGFGVSAHRFWRGWQFGRRH